jgi:lysozyme
MDNGQLTSELIRDEGLRLKPYTDAAGKLTIGVGRNLTDRGISHEEAMALLQNDIAAHTALLDRELPWWTRLEEPRQLALANMAFNLGVGPTPEQPEGKLLGFKTFLSLLAGGDYAAAADDLAGTRWASQVGARATRIIAVIRGN